MNRLNALVVLFTLLMIIGAGYATLAFLQDPTPPATTVSLSRSNLHARSPLTHPTSPTATLVSTAFPAKMSKSSVPGETTPLSTTPPAPHLSNIHFHFDRSGFSQAVQDTLDHHADLLLQNPSWNVLIQGHTDQEGTVASNMKVGLRRANAVKHYLKKRGVPADRLHVVSLGEYAPICLESTAACREQNRRVTFSVAMQEPSIPPIPLANPEPAKEQLEAEIVQPGFPVTDHDETSVGLTDQLTELTPQNGPVYFSPALPSQPAPSTSDLTVSTLDESIDTPEQP